MPNISQGYWKKQGTTLSDTKSKTKSNNNDDEGILNAFTATVDPPKGITEVADEE